ncbi:MAG: hypothetical protein PHD11_02110 [Bacteroidales bacterium]|nr:hypothetical protein [Bacteroidales bacterium]MDD4669861.1 hypothetical protein [Bacteroidales bacterium]
MKVIKYIEYILLVLSLILLVIFFVILPTSADAPMMDIFLYWAYLLLAVTLILVLFFSIKSAAGSKKGIKNLILLVIGMIVIVGGAYLLAPGTPVETNKPISDATYKFTDTALYITYFVFAVSVLAIIGGAVFNAIKNK